MLYCRIWPYLGGKNIQKGSFSAFDRLRSDGIATWLQLSCPNKVTFSTGRLSDVSDKDKYVFLFMPWRLVRHLLLANFELFQSERVLDSLCCEINVIYDKFVINYHEEVDMTHTHNLNARSTTIIKMLLVKAICGRTCSLLQKKLSYSWPVRNILYINTLKIPTDPSMWTPPNRTKKISPFFL